MKGWVKGTRQNTVSQESRRVTNIASRTIYSRETWTYDETLLGHLKN